MKGLFITFEGTEGSGKSTQIAFLAESLRAEGRDPLLLREPGGTPVGEQLRSILKDPANAALTAEAEFLLMNASRAQLVRERILPALAEGRIVLCDRFADSSVAYQAFGRGLDRATVERIIEFATGGVSPDLTLLLMAPAGVSEARRKSREAGSREGPDRFEQAGNTFFTRVAQGYESLAESGAGRVRRIDASAGPEVVRAAVWREARELLDREPISER